MSFFVCRTLSFTHFLTLAPVSYWYIQTLHVELNYIGTEFLKCIKRIKTKSVVELGSLSWSEVLVICLCLSCMSSTAYAIMFSL